MNIIIKNIKDIIPYKDNPRNNNKAVEFVVNSIREFGIKQPIVIDSKNEIIAGHTRYLACKKLKINEIPCVLADDLTERQVKAYRIADNSTGAVSEWDIDLLNTQIDDLPGFDFKDFGLDLDLDVDSESKDVEKLSDKYSIKINAPIYTIRGEEPEISDLIDRQNTLKILENINNSNIDNDIKEFLCICAERHTVINFEKVAEFYAHQNKEVQELMEENALVIIDFEKAIERGFCKLKDWYNDMLKKSLQNDDYEE